MEMESAFLYDDTPDQRKASNDVKKDMESPRPMDRLVCGDVGFGKTEVAMRAAFLAAAFLFAMNAVLSCCWLCCRLRSNQMRCPAAGRLVASVQ